MLSTSFVPLNIAENENHVKKGDKDQLTKKMPIRQNGGKITFFESKRKRKERQSRDTFAFAEIAGGTGLFVVK